MRRPPAKAKRDANEPEIFLALRSHGLSVESIDLPCDAIVGYGGKTYLVEIKGINGKLTPPQVKFLDTWKGHYIILRTVDEAITFAQWVRYGDPI